MVRPLIPLLALVAGPAIAQTVTVAAPLPDGNGDGRVTVGGAAARLGVPRGTVLTRCGGTLTYVGPASACPGDARARRPGGPVAPAPAAAAPRPVPATPAAGALAIAAPRLSRPGRFGAPRLLGSRTRIGNLTLGGLAVVARPRGTAPGVTIADVVTEGASYLLRSFTFADQVPDLTVERVMMRDNGAGGILVRGASSGTIRDVVIEATRPNTDCGRVPEGIALAGKGQNDTGGPWTIARVRVTGIRSVGCRFLNGDGLSVERGYRNVAVTDAYFGFNSDAGADVKSPTARLDRVTAEGNRRNFKFWADQTHGTLTSIDPGGPGTGAPAHVQLQGTATATRTLHIARLIARGETLVPLFEIENGAWNVTVDACELRLPAGTKLVAGAPALVAASTVRLAPSCTIR